jgi:integrase
MHARDWRNSLTNYVLPTIGDLPVSTIDTGLVLRVLEPIWTTKRVTAARVRSRLESVLDWAKARGYREGENPARWRGHLDHLLPARRREPVGHHAALPYRDVPAFVAEIRSREDVAALCLRFLVYTAARLREATEATWDEIDGEVWTIPANRMKSGAEHRVPLSRPVLDILPQLPRQGRYVFPGSPDRPVIKGHCHSNAGLVRTDRIAFAYG